MAGKDVQGRELILMYEFKDLVKYSKINLLARQLSDFNIVCLKGHPSNPNFFVSGGKENIRYWKVKSRSLITGTSIVLNANGRDKVFTDIAYEVERNEDGKILRSTFCYLCTANGELFKVNNT